MIFRLENAPTLSESPSMNLQQSVLESVIRDAPLFLNTLRRAVRSNPSRDPDRKAMWRFEKHQARAAHFRVRWWRYLNNTVR